MKKLSTHLSLMVYKVLSRLLLYPAYMDNYLKEVIEQVENETGYNLLTTGMGSLHKCGQGNSTATLGHLQYR